ncbi:TetR/AcrR family transcriptional regulator [Amycolatopsis sp. EV170708-02-1]|uniref:TetR/AcrR family transcriptional regulator n=1 Tax=Amycolatopsis sp. EV170708-02-1 TaxID=2919322 RepID=UPI001F0C1A5E|nr:TetR/AcrR family transcriptional regulator [Amycolatopsis sp. EV170708-02-1]UMP00051.1 TetR/AcrR family transcriptional regulator [Amycolatopsis sp. EV170708-02-1]
MAAKPSLSPRRSNRAGEDARQRIMAAAVRLFAENGYHATGIEMLSSETQIGRGAMYHHIGSKEALLFEICHTRMSDLLTRSGRILAVDASYEQRFRELMRSTMRNLADHALEWTVSFQEFRALTGQRRVVVQEARDRYERMVAELLEGGAEAGEFRRLDPLVTKGILGQYNYSYAWIRPHGKRTPEEIADLFTDTLLRGVLEDPMR